jgi:hypothetical protein
MKKAEMSITAISDLFNLKRKTIYFSNRLMQSGYFNSVIFLLSTFPEAIIL